MKLKIGEVKLLMVEQNLTQDELAEKADLSRISISYFMNGKNASVKSINKIANALNVSIRDIVEMN
ncbi:helix-turn-helix domain-containing protein [Urinicoccus massiliensis]|uniref:helix-turn-helix domain-containing protein n=1 Tax=Urinicoccus massiliensis TaxID=1723382 RepID=UPI0009319741|nr:helix-turn-helix transcriptional regulator [Urinicoccus massiliensis]